MRLALLLLVALLLPWYPAQAQRPPAPAAPPALVVLLVIDQLRSDYLDRWEQQFTGGLGRLRREGVLYAQGQQDHAMTETAPGHSTLLSGRSPASVGIVSNLRGVPDSAHPLLGVAGPGASPHRFVGTTLYDWMLARWPGARVLSLSRKDRGAILPVGRARGEVYWYHGGRFTTSRYYRDALPDWLERWNRRQPLRRLAGSRWTLSRPDSAYPEPDDMPYERGGIDRTFPHRLASRASIGDSIAASPWMDSLTLDAALTGVRAMQLGRGREPDLLVVSLSTSDAIGHAWGPDSREIHDHLLRLDGWLGDFLAALGREVPMERTVIALASDHGVTSFPEAPAPPGVRRGRVWLGDALQAVHALERRWQTRLDASFENGLLFADTVALAARGVRVDSLAEALARAVLPREGIQALYTPASLAAAPDGAPGARRWRRTIPPGRGWLLAGVAERGWIWASGPGTTTHGTTWDEDVLVPMLFRVPGLAGRRVERRVRTEDIAPTLAALLGIEPTEPVEGIVLPEVVPAGPGTGDR